MNLKIQELEQERTNPFRMFEIHQQWANIFTYTFPNRIT